MDNKTFMKKYAEQKDLVKRAKRVLYEYEEELERRLNEGELKND